MYLPYLPYPKWLILQGVNFNTNLIFSTVKVAILPNYHGV